VNRARVLCGAGLVVAVAAINLAGHTPSHPAPRPVATATATDWPGRMADARVALTAAQTAPDSDQLTGQDPKQRHRNCLNAVALFDQAAAHLHTDQLQPSKECP
jgi:hypothetical protein